MNYRNDRMKQKWKLLCQLAGITTLLAACAGESSFPTATGSSTFRIINAIPTSPSVALLIEERTIAGADYKGVSAPSEYDDLEYTFNFETFLPGNVSRTRLASLFVDTQPDLAYTFLVTGDLTTPTITLWEQPRREWAATDTVFEIRFAHAAESLGSVDAYFQAPGVAPVLGDQIATMQFGDESSTVELPAGDYVLILTTPNDPNDVLFASTAITPAVAAGYSIALFDADADDIDPIAVRLHPDNGGALRIVDENSTPVIRFFHATQFLDTSDVYTDEMLLDQILANHTYRDVSAELPLAAGSYTLTYTAAGNTGSILLEDDVGLQQGIRYEHYAVGEMGALGGILLPSDRRSVETLVKFSFMHTATNHDSADLYILTAGDDIATSFPRVTNLTVGAPPANLNLQAGDFELYLTPRDQKTVLAGPIAFSPMLGDVVNYLSYDNVDPAIADIVAIPLP